MALLKKHLKRKVQIEAVCGGDGEATLALERIRVAGIGYEGQPTPYGFSEYIARHGVEEFLAR